MYNSATLRNPTTMTMTTAITPVLVITVLAVLLHWVVLSALPPLRPLSVAAADASLQNDGKNPYALLETRPAMASLPQKAALFAQHWRTR
jgi:hypothetical protein